jgi:TonB family protein
MAASAPAPAKETPKASVPPSAFEAEQAVGPITAPAKSASSRPATSLEKDEFQAPAAPSFGFPTSAAQESTEELPSHGGSKKGILIAIAVLVLAVAGYFGYTKFLSAKRAQTAPGTVQTPSPVIEQSEPSTVVSAPAPTSASAAASTPPATTKLSAGSAIPTASEKEDFSEESDVTVKRMDEAPRLVVKSGAAPKATGKTDAAAEVAAPSLGMKADDSAISDIVQSTGTAVPRIAAPPQTLKVSQGVTQGLLLKRVQPVYPQQALQMHVQGAVQLQATINKEGKITSIKVLGGDPMLSRAAVDAVYQWRYKPYYLNGDPVEIQTQIIVNFKLPLTALKKFRLNATR